MLFKPSLGFLRRVQKLSTIVRAPPILFGWNRACINRTVEWLNITAKHIETCSANRPSFFVGPAVSRERLSLVAQMLDYRRERFDSNVPQFLPRCFHSNLLGLLCIVDNFFSRGILSETIDEKL